MVLTTLNFELFTKNKTKRVFKTTFTSFGTILEDVSVAETIV